MSGAGTPDFFYREAQRLGYVARSAFKLLQIQKQHKLITQGSSVLDLGCAPGAWLQVACQSLGPLKNGGTVVGIDLKKVKVPPLYCDARVHTVCADVMKLPKNQVRALSPRHKGFSVVLSDMCPLVSGITTRDAALSVELGMQALDLAVGRAAATCLDEDIRTDGLLNDSVCAADDNGILHPGGHLVIKLLESEDNKGGNMFMEQIRVDVVTVHFLLPFNCLPFCLAEFSRICKPLFRKASWLRPKATRSSSREIYLICQGLRS
ncbi:RRNA METHYLTRANSFERASE 2 MITOCHONDRIAL [Salix koriyanagi]|uniref:rRNA methyltransferase 2, mitochondrial n=1 Tax=Salix koriyanagi TaxID=2511006 RepID=A0A9Q0WUG5_9ROSI|nr:RRNA METHYLTRANSFERASE 2 MITOCHONDRIAL [Salix koriyanagi]